MSVKCFRIIGPKFLYFYTAEVDELLILVKYFYVNLSVHIVNIMLIPRDQPLLWAQAAVADDDDACGREGQSSVCCDDRSRPAVRRVPHEAKVACPSLLFAFSSAAPQRRPTTTTSMVRKNSATRKQKFIRICKDTS